MTALPNTSDIHDEAIRGNFEAIEDTTGVVSKAYRSTALTIKAAKLERVSVDKVVFDPSKSFDLVNGVYVVRQSGFYLTMGCVAYQATAEACTFIASIFRNGVEYSRPTRILETGAEPDLLVADVVPCNTGDRIELFTYCGLEKALQIGSIVNYLTVMKIP